MNKPIGILDSGFGGLSIWKDVVHELPNESIIYAGDNANCPYGSREVGEIRDLSERLVRFLLEKDVKLIVVACNTITVHALSFLRESFPNIPIVGTVPVIKTATQTSKNKKIGILSTIRTAESRYQKDLIRRFADDCKVVNVGTDELVPLVECGEEGVESLRPVLQKILKPFILSSIDTLALGCSHFPFLKGQMQAILGSNVTILDSGSAIARQVRRVLTTRNELSRLDKPVYTFYTSGTAEQFKKVASKLLKVDIVEKVEKVESL